MIPGKVLNFINLYVDQIPPKLMLNNIAKLSLVLIKMIKMADSDFLMICPAASYSNFTF